MFRIVGLAGTVLWIACFAAASAPLPDALIVAFAIALGMITAATSIAAEETHARALREPGTLSFAELGGAGRLSNVQSIGSNK